ncbi:MAG: ATP-dependent DNA helicase [Bifidobacteriaceae bacterium]|jgi:ATP-dependent DNA helicase DinG|nr:ATP-dependent DNA helicase [Bifidobacteriaceae bacterium]
MAEPAVAELLGAVVRDLGGQRREGQERMAEAVWAAFVGGRHLLVQAGTGTGKSLAYLTPAAAFAVREEQKVVVATATLALQRQIVARDLPLATAALGRSLGRRPVAALLKGRHNYLCRYKLDGGYPDEQGELFDAADLGDGAAGGSGGGGRGSLTGSDLADEVRRLTRWAAEAATGDRDDFPGGASPRAWRQVSVRSAQCVGSRCPLFEECFAEAARAAAARADLIVTNHAMLAIDAAGTPVLPEHAAVVVDEAHALTRSLTTAQTVELTAGQVATAANQVGRLKLDADGLRAAGDELALALGAAPEGRLREGLGEALRDAVAQVRAAARDAFSEVAKASEGLDTARQVASASLQELTDTAVHLADAEGQVHWIARPAVGLAAVKAAPLDVAEHFRATVLDSVTAVLTSATLALGGSLEAAAEAVGLGQGEWDGLDVGSPFDYRRQAILYLAADLPEPGRDEAHWSAQHARLRELIEAAGGGALGLFTSQQAAEAAAEALAPELDCGIGVQGEKSLPALIEDFKADPSACLFGTISLWQGIDAPGLTCRLVAIDRLAFPRPDDPLMSARIEAANRAGRSGFMTVAAAHSALMLAQGAGRLIRSLEDQGVVAVLDPRIATKRYGSFLLRSLPPMWRTTNLEVVLGALRRLAAAAANPKEDPAP